MSVLLADVQRELNARISPYQPALAPRLASRLSLLPDSELALILASESALVRAVDNAVAQEMSPKVYRVMESTLCEETVIPSVRAVSPLPAYRAVRAVSPLPSVRAVSPLPSVRAVSPLRSTVITSPLRTVVTSPKYIGGLYGLDEFLGDLGLSQYSLRAQEWVATMGATTLYEVMENQTSFADFIGLRPLERSRLIRDGNVVAARWQPREVVLA